MAVLVTEKVDYRAKMLPQINKKSFYNSKKGQSRRNNKLKLFCTKQQSIEIYK